MRVLLAGGGGEHLHLIAANFLRQSPPFGNGCKDFQLGLSAECEAAAHKEQ
jgi:hypothetical protein